MLTIDSMMIKNSLRLSWLSTRVRRVVQDVDDCSVLLMPLILDYWLFYWYSRFFFSLKCLHWIIFFWLFVAILFMNFFCLQIVTYYFIRFYFWGCSQFVLFRFFGVLCVSFEILMYFIWLKILLFFGLNFFLIQYLICS